MRERERDRETERERERNSSDKEFKSSHLLLLLSLQFCEGGDLATYIAEHAPLKESDIAFLLKQIANAMQYLREKGIVHRDLKPQVRNWIFFGG